MPSSFLSICILWISDLVIVSSSNGLSKSTSPTGLIGSSILVISASTKFSSVIIAGGNSSSFFTGSV
jgi:hypothetical protein